MAGETVSSNVTTLILAKAVDRLLTWYQYDLVTFLGFARFRSIQDEATTTAAFNRPTKNAAAAVASETTTMTPTTFATTAVDVAVSRSGLAREVSETVLEDTVLGRAAFMSLLLEDAARLIGELAETDFAAQFANASTSVGTTNTAATIANLVSMIGQQRTNKARGAQVFCLSDAQMRDIQAAQIAATGTPWAAFMQPNADGTEYGGVFMGAPMFASGLCATANAGVDKVGSIFSQGQANPAFCAFAFVQKRPPTMKSDVDIWKDTVKIAALTRYGVGTPATNFATKLVTKAT
jgi:hypothetical protein